MLKVAWSAGTAHWPKPCSARFSLQAWSYTCTQKGDSDSRPKRGSWAPAPMPTSHPDNQTCAWCTWYIYIYLSYLIMELYRRHSDAAKHI